MLPDVSRAFSDDIAIDLGTANTLVYVVGRGIIIDEPSMVAVGMQYGVRQIFAVGAAAQRLVGRTPEPVEILKPMRDGVIADFVAVEEMLRQFIRRAKSMLGFRRPRILIAVPAGATPVERKAVYDTALSVGARQVLLVAEPVAAALGAGLPVDDAKGVMVLDIGGGTSDIAVLSYGRVMQSRSLRCAGNAIDAAIVRYVRRRHDLKIGEASAERIKVEAGAASPTSDPRPVEVRIRGREVSTGRPKGVTLTSADIGEALAPVVTELAEFVERALEDLPFEVVAEIRRQGICLTGGGALLDGLDRELSRRLGIHFELSSEPLRCVIKGTALILESLRERSHLLLDARR
jgi:rod shape-determining protein MreB